MSAVQCLYFKHKFNFSALSAAPFIKILFTGNPEAAAIKVTESPSYSGNAAAAFFRIL